MSSKMVLWVVILTVSSLSAFQIYGLVIRKPSGDESGVLAISTTLSLEQRLSSLESRVLILERNTGLIKPRSTGQLKEQFLQLTGGSIVSSEWLKIPGSEFELDASLYGGSVEVSWQGWMDNGKGSVRIYDDTNHRVVDNSELSVDSGVMSSFYSKPISIWRGLNHYYLEGKNPWGEMTVSSPRLRILSR
jgi:hypothetical protein